MDSNFVQQQELKAYRFMPPQQWIRLTYNDRATITNGIVAIARFDKAIERNDKLRRLIEQQNPVGKRFKLIITAVLALIGALICSAAAQAITIPLDHRIVPFAIPLVAGVVMVGSEELGRTIIRELRLKQLLWSEQLRLHKNLTKDDLSKDNKAAPMQRVYQQTQLDLVETVEGRPFPILELIAVGIISLIEIGATFWFISQEHFLLAILICLTPVAYVMAASLIMARILGYREALLTLASTYETYLTPQAAAPELTTVPDVSPAVDFPGDAFSGNAVPAPAERLVDVTSNGHVAVPNVVLPNVPHS